MVIDVKISTIYLLISLIIYTFISKLIFDNVYAVTKLVIDEEFHLPLGESYCKFDFTKWDPKVTTLPGLYLLSSLILGPFQQCSIYALRFVNLLGSIFNLFILYLLFKKCNKQADWKNLVSAINLSILPPLYFFSHVYYTDVLSLSMILVMILLKEYENHFFASIFGAFAVVFRQTNVIWVGMVLGELVLTEIDYYSQKQCKTLVNKVRKDFFKVVTIDLTRIVWLFLKNASLQFWLNFLPYFATLVSFVIFVYLNGSIVVGDKSAHTATTHFPQLFYFSLFCIIFAWPYFITEIFNFCSFIKKHKLLTALFISLSTIIVATNTLVHPYLLADNRHYIFYIWNRFYSRYEFFKFLMVPIYIFALFVILKKLSIKNNYIFTLIYIPCIVVVLITQKLIEPRYFLIPYVLFRLKLQSSQTYCLLLEFLTYILINAVTFKIFFDKVIIWDNMEYPQRIIW